MKLRWNEGTRNIFHKTVLKHAEKQKKEPGKTNETQSQRVEGREARYGARIPRRTRQQRESGARGHSSSRRGSIHVAAAF
jgi:hypothetical protein